MVYVVGIDVGHRSLGAAERWLLSVLTTLDHDPGRIACTHVVARPYQHVALTWTAAGPGPGGAAGVLSHLSSAALAGAATAAGEHTGRRAGRAVVFPGCDRLTGVMGVDELLALSAIEQVVMLDAAVPRQLPPSAQAKVDTRDHVRPQWSRGRLTLLVRQRPGGLVVPFEGPQRP